MLDFTYTQPRPHTQSLTCPSTHRLTSLDFTRSAPQPIAEAHPATERGVGGEFVLPCVLRRLDIMTSVDLGFGMVVWGQPQIYSR